MLACLRVAELVAENQQRKVHSGERSRTMGRHHLNPNLHQYQGKPVPQVPRMPFFEVGARALELAVCICDTLPRRPTLTFACDSPVPIAASCVSRASVCRRKP